MTLTIGTLTAFLDLDANPFTRKLNAAMRDGEAMGARMTKVGGQMTKGVTLPHRTVAANLDAPVEEKAQLLETVDAKDRIRKVLRLLTRQLELIGRSVGREREAVAIEDQSAIRRDRFDPDAIAL